MYEFLYDYVFPKWGVENVWVCGTDTDSLILARTKDLPKDILDDIPEHFDTSKFKRTDFDGTIFPKMNRKKLGKMKDELAGQFMSQFAATAPKCYGYEFLKLDGTISEDARCKGIPKGYTPKFQKYLECVQGEEGKEVHKTCYRINSKNHDLFTIKTNKVAMRNTVVKRVRHPNEKYETLPFGSEKFIHDAPLALAF